MKLFIEKDYDALSKRAADIFAAELRKNTAGVFGFATGATPVGMYRELIRMASEEGLDFSRMTSFNLDEYYPIQKSNDQSYDYFMRENLFNHIPMNPDRINIPNGEAPDADEECAAYERKVENAGSMALQILGIGNHGHIAFNEPDRYFAGATHYVTLDESTIKANARFFASEAEVPRHALSMGIRTIMMSKKILLLASGKKKADALYEMLHGPITPALPASVLQLHQDVIVVADEDAAARIK